MTKSHTRAKFAQRVSGKWIFPSQSQKIISKVQFLIVSSFFCWFWAAATSIWRSTSGNCTIQARAAVDCYQATSVNIQAACAKEQIDRFQHQHQIQWLPQPIHRNPFGRQPSVHRAVISCGTLSLHRQTKEPVHRHPTIECHSFRCPAELAAMRIRELTPTHRSSPKCFDIDITPRRSIKALSIYQLIELDFKLTRHSFRWFIIILSISLKKLLSCNKYTYIFSIWIIIICKIMFKWNCYERITIWIFKRAKKNHGILRVLYL